MADGSHFGFMQIARVVDLLMDPRRPQIEKKKSLYRLLLGWYTTYGVNWIIFT